MRSHPLFKAIADNNIEGFKKALKDDKIDFNTTASYQLFNFPEPIFNDAFSPPAEYTPLMAAVAKGNCEMVTLLTQAGAKATEGEAMLMMAAKGGDAKMIETLVDHKLTGNIDHAIKIYDDGIYAGEKTALTEAISAKSATAVRMLLNKWAKTNIARDDFGRSEVELAKSTGDKKTIQVIQDFETAEKNIVLLESKSFTGTEKQINTLDFKAFYGFPNRYPCDRLTIMIDNNDSVKDANKEKAKSMLENRYFAEIGFIEYQQSFHRPSKNKPDSLEKTYLHWLKVKDPTGIPADIAFEMALHFKKNNPEFLNVNHKFKLNIDDESLSQELKIKSETFIKYAALRGQAVALDYVRDMYLKDEKIQSIAGSTTNITLEILMKHLSEFTEEPMQDDQPYKFFSKSDNPLSELKFLMKKIQTELEKKTDTPFTILLSFFSTEVMPRVDLIQQSLQSKNSIHETSLKILEWCQLANNFQEQLKIAVRALETQEPQMPRASP